MNANTSQTNRNEVPDGDLNEPGITELSDGELEKIAGGMLACNKIAPCI